MTKSYSVVRGMLQPHARLYPERQAPPFSRPVLESGTAFKTVYLSKAPPSYTAMQLHDALEAHIWRMRKELQASGKMVRKVITTVTGQDGDVRVQMMWEVLGAKRNKHYRRIHGKVGTDAHLDVTKAPDAGTEAGAAPSPV